MRNKIADGLRDNCLFFRTWPLAQQLQNPGHDSPPMLLRAALEQRGREIRAARQDAVGLLRAELKDDVTALLLSCGLAFQERGLTETVTLRIKTIEEVAHQIRRKLSVDDNQPASIAAHA